MKTLKIYILILSLVAFVLSCDINDKFGTTSNEYDLEYSVEAYDTSISKVIYTNTSGEAVELNDVKDDWKLKTIGRSGQTIKLEVYGEKQNSDVLMQIFAKNGEAVVQRNIIKEKTSNKYFHYYIIHVLE